MLYKKSALARGGKGIVFFAILLVLMSVFAGCASFKTVQSDISYEDGKPIRAITTEAKTSAFLTGKTHLSRWKASQSDMTQGASVGEISSEQTNNLNSIIESIISSAIKAARQP